MKRLRHLLVQLREVFAQLISVHAHYKIDFIGILGMTGLTAYFGLLDICKPEPGETLVVSGAAGAVGTVVGQIGLLKGCRVIGIAGGKDKCAYLKNELKFHEVIDYKTSDKEFQEALRKATPKYINIYFDNGRSLLRSRYILTKIVGGKILDACLARAAPHARFSICGGYVNSLLQQLIRQDLPV